MTEEKKKLTMKGLDEKVECMSTALMDRTESIESMMDTIQSRLVDSAKANMRLADKMEEMRTSMEDVTDQIHEYDHSVNQGIREAEKERSLLAILVGVCTGVTLVSLALVLALAL